MALIRECEPRDFSSLGLLMRVTHGHPVPVEEIERQEQALQTGWLRGRWVAEVDGQVVGYSVVARTAGHKAGWFNHRLAVEEEFRRQGIGSALYEAAMGFAITHGGSDLSCPCFERSADGISFLENRGWKVKHRVFESELNPQFFELEPFIPLIEKLRSEGVFFEPFSAEPDEHRLYELYADTYKDIPGASIVEQFTFDEFRYSYLNSPTFRADGVFLAKQSGEWIGLSSVGKPPNGEWTNTMSGVRRAHRSRGLALALKALTTEYCRSIGVTRLMTENDSTNAPMLAVNDKLGYQRKPGWLIYQALLDSSPRT